MNITELDQYRLADAVKFHNRLNPKLWGPDEQLLPEVRSKLLEIAADFQEFLGVSDLDVKDITLSGSNAAYSYTPHSDIDLHLVVDVPEDEVYQELFNAKKYQYNDMHDIRIRGADVELYVQPAAESPVSLGEYSIKNDQWIEVPKRKRARIDQNLVRHKYEDLRARIESALKEDDSERVQALATKIKAMRKAGLDQHGEFGPENLAYKILRKQGLITRLYDHMAATRDRELSLKEQPRQPVRYGFGEGHQGQPYSSEDGVAGSTCMFLNETDKDEELLHEFIRDAAEQLGIESMPEVVLHRDDDWGVENHSFGRYEPDTHTLHVNLAGRHIMDIFRTTAHELAHCRQHELKPLPDNAGETGSPWENQAHATAGVIMRHWADRHPEMFDTDTLEEGVHPDVTATRYFVNPTKNVRMGDFVFNARTFTGSLADPNARGLQIRAYDPKQPKVTIGSADFIVQTDKKGNRWLESEDTEVDPKYQGKGVASMMYAFAKSLGNDVRPSPFQSKAGRQMWHKWGPDSGNLVKEASGYIPTGKQKNDPRFKTALTVDVHPGQTGREANKLALDTDSQGRPGLLMKTANLREGRVRDLNDPPGPEFKPTMPAGTVRVDVSDMYDWYKLGQHISNMKGLGRHDFGSGPPSTIFSFGDEDLEHQYIDALKRTGLTTTDIDPVDPKQPPGMPRQKVDPTYNVSEAFDQPYALTWERGDHGDWSASAQMPDGKYIEILFTRWDKDRDNWDVEFYRNNSQDVTGEGDAMRVFATVMQAVRKFANKIKPGTVKLAATKDVEPGVKPESRARLYQRMAQRFAADMGYNVQVQDRGIQVNFVFTKQTPVTEAANRLHPDIEEFLRGLTPDDVGVEEFGPYRVHYEGFTDDCKTSSDYCENPEAVYQQVFRDFVKREGGAQPVDSGMVGDEDYPILYSVFKVKQDVAEDDLAESLRREFEILESQYITEISMRPSTLRQEAAKTGAIAGMEFEMIVPNANVDDEPESEIDWDADESVNDIDDACNFFHDGDYNGRRAIADLREEMTSQYEEWYDERKKEAWDEEGSDYIRDWLWRTYEDEWREEAEREVLSDTPEFGTNNEELQQRIEEFVNEKWEAATEDVLANMGSDWDAAYEEWDEDWRGNNDLEQEWLRDQGYETMRDIADHFDITWPYYYTPESSGTDINAVANDFSDAVGMPVNASSSYHGGRREPGHYVVEPDGSLEPDDSDDGGLEFVSPPMPIDELLDQLKKVKAWAGRYGCYTNESTGLHINISVPNYDLAKLDYVKLALLMGDEYVLDQFGRSSNTYAKSAMGKIKNILRDYPDKAQAVLDKMKGHMDDLATKAIHSGTTDKYTSINTKSGYIEFRSPGGDWLDENFDKVENTLLRFTVALSAAMDPAAYREEYLKKLYKLLSPKGEDDPIAYFAKYSAGQLPKAALRSFVKQVQLQRRIKRGETGDQPMWWNVSWGNGRVEVVAKTQQEALDTAFRESYWAPDQPNTPEAQRFRASLKATPIRPYDQSPVKASVGEPQAIGRSSGATLNGRPSNPDGNYVITPEDDRSSVYYRFAAAGFDDANTVRRQWAQQHPDRVWVVQRDDNRTLGQPPFPGSTLDLQRQRATQAPQQSAPQPLGAGRELVGWSVRLPSGEEVAQIRGIGNNQGDANRIAADLLRQRGYGVSGEGFEVVPVWREA